ncbi:MAG: hypothetical protein ABI342_04200 [Nitrososphaera sp.]|jgi:hypothetical protein
MDEATYRILDILTRNLGKPLSINELTGKIEEIYGRTYYANTNEKIHDLAKDGTITLSKAGRSWLISINFNNYLIIDLLAEMELRRKQDFLQKKQEMQMLMMEIDTYLHSFLLIKSISLMNPEKNSRLNKTELLIHLSRRERDKVEEAKIGIHAIIDTLKKIHNIRIDYLILEDKMFLNLLKSDEINSAREMLSNKIVILNPQDFWIEIKKAGADGIKIIAEENEVNPAKISDEDLIFNLARFGYTEMGPTIKQGRLICIEYIIIAIIFQNDARRIDAIPVILAKNSDKTNYDILLFLARKYGFGGRILGILKTLRNLMVHGMKMIDEPIRLLEAMKIEEIKANQKSIKEKLRLYNVT